MSRKKKERLLAQSNYTSVLETYWIPTIATMTARLYQHSKKVWEIEEMPLGTSYCSSLLLHPVVIYTAY